MVSREGLVTDGCVNFVQSFNVRLSRVKYRGGGGGENNLKVMVSSVVIIKTLNVYLVESTDHRWG